MFGAAAAAARAALVEHREALKYGAAAGALLAVPAVRRAAWRLVITRFSSQESALEAAQGRLAILEQSMSSVRSDSHGALQRLERTRADAAIAAKRAGDAAADVRRLSERMGTVHTELRALRDGLRANSLGVAVQTRSHAALATKSAGELQAELAKASKMGG